MEQSSSSAAAAAAAQVEQTNYFEHSYDDYVNGMTDLNALRTQCVGVFLNDLRSFLERVSAEQPVAICSSANRQTRLNQNHNAYDGATGYLAAYLRVYDFLTRNRARIEEQRAHFQDIKDEEFFALIDAQQYLDRAAKCYAALLAYYREDAQMRARHTTFLFSEVGAHTLACEMYYAANDVQKFNECLQKIMVVHNQVLAKGQTPEVVHEILYGTSGFLYCLLRLQVQFQFREGVKEGFALRLEHNVLQVCKVILKAGEDAYNINKAQLQNKTKRLLYRFHNVEYIGAAHGYFGILYLLLRAYELNADTFRNYGGEDFTQKFLTLVRETCDFVVTYQLADGNFPAQTQSKRKISLVQFCHGSPGSIPFLLTAYRVYKDDRFLHSAMAACENTWVQGILKKGFGLCHGITGNAYAFITAAKAFAPQRNDYRALRFLLVKRDPQVMEIISKYEHSDRFVIGQTDFPFSLMLGLAGDIYFAADALEDDAHRYGFPGYEV